MLNLCDVLEFIIDTFDYGSFAQKNSVRHTHESPFHVALQLGDELYAVHEEFLEKVLADIPLVCHEFVEDHFNESLVLQRFPVIHIARCDHEVEQFALLVADEVQLESEEPSHGALASGRKALECLMDMDALVLANTKGRGVNEADTGALAHEHLLEEDDQRDGLLLLQLNETVIGDHLREQVAQAYTDLIQVEMFQASVAGIVEHYHNGHNLGNRKATIPVIRPLSACFWCIETIFIQQTAKNFVKFICHKENFSNFVLGEHSEYCLYNFVIQHYKGTTIFANHQIFRQLYFHRTHVIYSRKLIQ